MGIGSWFLKKDEQKAPKKGVDSKVPNEKVKKPDLNKELKTTGIILIALGVLHFLLSGFLDLTWGLVLIPIGIITFLYRTKKMVIVLGIVLILAGILNFYTNVTSSMYGESSSPIWNILPFFQIYWGIQSITRYKKLEENPKYIVKENKKRGFVWYGLRISFFVLIFFWIFERVVSERIIAEAPWTFSILEWAVLLFVLIISIIHLSMYKKKDFAVLSLGIAVILILLTSYSLIGMTKTQFELPANYGVYREFTKTYQINELKLEFSSSLPIDVYFVPSEEDFNNFMAGERYNKYPGCYFENKDYGVIKCEVSTGGIIIYNPNFVEVTYTIK